MKKKILAMILVLSMVVGFLLGCTGNTPKGEEAVASDSGNSSSDSTSAVNAFAGTELTVAVYKHSMDKSTDFKEKPGFKAAEEATGIHINWVYIDAGTETEKVNIMLTSDMPDVFLGILGQDHISANINSFYDLSKDDLLETYAPNVIADYKTIEDGMGLVTWPDGSIRSLMTGCQVSYNNDADGIMVMNKKWLDKLGLSVPTTADEFYKVLCAFRDNDMNGNGDATDEIPFEFSESNWAAKMLNLANPWGIAGDASSKNESAYLKVEDGKVKPTVNTQEFRAFLEYNNKLAKERLLDVEGFSQTNEQYYAKLKEGVVGCYYAWTAYANFSPEEAANWVVVPPFSAMEGVKPVKTGHKDRLTAERCGFAIASDCGEDKVKAALTWWNYLSSSTEMKYTVRYGEKGQDWDIVDGKVVMCTPEGITEAFTKSDYEYTNGMVDRCPFIRKDESATIKEDPNDTNYIRQKMVDQVEDYLAGEYLPTRFADVDKTNERLFLENELFGYVYKFIATSIVEGINDTTWNEYLTKLDSLQYDEWIDWYQKFYDDKY